MKKKLQKESKRINEEINRNVGNTTEIKKLQTTINKRINSKSRDSKRRKRLQTFKKRIEDIDNTKTVKVKE